MPSYESYSKNYLFILGGHLADMMILSLLWLVFSIPIVTTGASTAALYYATTKHFNDASEKPFQDFFHSFKQNLKQGILLSLIYLVYGGLLAFDIYVARNGFRGITLPAIYEQIAYVLTLPIVFTLPYVFAYLSRFNNTIKETLKHCFFFCATHILHTLILLLLVIASGIAMALFPPCALVVPALCAYLCSHYIEKDFRQALEIRNSHSVSSDEGPSAETPHIEESTSERVDE
jgi:uncharacterized membrane protein YesL